MSSSEGLVATLGRGHVLDQTPEGIVRTRADMSDLVPVPIRTYSGRLSEIVGTNGSSISIAAGSSMGSSIGVPTLGILTTGETKSETKSGIAVLEMRVWGRRIGLWAQSPFNQDPTLCVFVNRELTYAGNLGLRIDGQLTPSTRNTFDSNVMLPIAQGLPDDGPHSLLIGLAASPVESQSFNLYALGLERRMGYITDQRLNLQTTALLLTEAMQEIKLGLRSAIIGVRFVNQSASAVTVTLEGSVSGEYTQESIAAHKEWVWLAAGGAPMVFNDALKAKASALTAVKAIPMEAS